MLTAKNPECSRCCRFVGTQFESGQDYGEYGIWRYRLTVRTWAFEACNSGSNPDNALDFLGPHSSGVERVTCNHKAVSSNLTEGFCCDVRVVKEFDLKSNGLCPRRFKSCSQRLGN